MTTSGNRQAFLELIEPQASAAMFENMSGEPRPDIEQAAKLSTAISLKRVADALQKLAGEGQGGWSLADIAGLIAERRGQ